MNSCFLWLKINFKACLFPAKIGCVHYPLKFYFLPIIIFFILSLEGRKYIISIKNKAIGGVKQKNIAAVPAKLNNIGE